jgi:hypothetical protein
VVSAAVTVVCAAAVSCRSDPLHVRGDASRRRPTSEWHHNGTGDCRYGIDGRVARVRAPGEPGQMERASFGNMAGAETGGTKRLVQWLLLACTVFGLATMHTLGHSGMHAPADGVHHLAESTAAAAAASGLTVFLAETADGCDGCTNGAAPVNSGGMAGWGICVAVLVSAATLALALMSAHRRRPARGPSGGADRQRLRSRRHRERPSALLLVTVSVLRI